jgi:hypothetical protein
VPEIFANAYHSDMPLSARVKNAKQKVQVDTESTCQAHPLLKQGCALPRSTSFEISPQELFGIATLRTQSPETGNYTFGDCEKGWRYMLGTYIKYLDVQSNLISAKVVDEQLRDVSELIGIAYGIKALTIEFDVELNRITRFSPKTKKKRVDFEFTKDNNRYFHETKGTIHQGRVNTLRQEILKQKLSTKSLLTSAVPPAVGAGYTGSITTYPHVKKATTPSQVFLIDPPPEPTVALPVLPNEELISVLRYYQNFYAVTHRNVVGELSLSQWLFDVIGELKAGSRPPTQPPPALVSVGRQSEPGRENSPYKGTTFDTRTTRQAVKRFRSFEDATIELITPVYFVGVSDEVTSLIRNCLWTKLLAFRDISQSGAERDNGAVLPSGVLIHFLGAQTEGYEISQRTFFDTLKKRFG